MNECLYRFKIIFALCLDFHKIISLLFLSTLYPSLVKHVASAMAHTVHVIGDAKQLDSARNSRLDYRLRLVNAAKRIVCM